jgi:putative transposase
MICSNTSVPITRRAARTTSSGCQLFAHPEREQHVAGPADQTDIARIDEQHAIGDDRARPLLRTAIVLKPSTIMSFHRALVKRKYRLLFTPKLRGKPGPKGPSPELIEAILGMKCRNPRFGYQRIVQQLALTFHIEIDKDVVRRVLAKHHRPDPSDRGASWPTFLGHARDSLWSVDLFRCESLILRSHWVMVVIDQFTRRIVGFPMCAGTPDGPTTCRMLGEVLGREGSLPKSLSSDHDPLFEFHR